MILKFNIFLIGGEILIISGLNFDIFSILIIGDTIVFIFFIIIIIVIVVLFVM